jgi:OOP family OmpA-OmpF porin
VDSERIAPAIAGVRRFVYSGTPPDVQLKEKLEAATIRFQKGESRIAPEQDDTLRAIAGLLDELNETLGVQRQRARVDVIGHTDADGSEDVNGPLSQARADAVRQLLESPVRVALDLAAIGVGTSSPLAAGATELEKERNRCVSFRVRLADSPARRSGPS